MLRQIYALLPAARKKECWKVVCSVLLRALLDFAGLAALLPVLLTLLGEDADRQKALLLCGAALLFVAVKNLLSIFLSRYQIKFTLNLYRQFSRSMFSNYYHRGLLFIKGKSSVQLAHEINVICYAFCINVLQSILVMIAESVLAVSMLVAILIWEPFAGGILCLGFLPIILIYVRIVKKKMRNYGKEEMEARRQQSRTVAEAFRGYSELEVNNAFQFLEDSFLEGLDTISQSRVKMDTIQKIPAFMSEGTLIIGLALLLLFTSGNLALVSGVFAVVAFRLIPAVRSIMGAWSTLQNSAFCIEIVAQGIQEEGDAVVQEEKGLTFHSELKVEHIDFSFDETQPLFTDFCCTIHKGECVGIKGASGSGKSTLFNILLGFFPLRQGRITIDGTPLSSMNLKAWHKLAGYVPQEIFIQKGTLAENIALGNKDIQEEKIWEILKQVRLDEWVKALPEGLHADLGEFGNRMSGGQKQRIGIARALYKEAEVLFFDEATSALDNQTELEINQAIEELSHNRHELTIIIIAHRESSLSFCDRIIELA